MGTIVLPSQNAMNEASSPISASSTTTVSPAGPNICLTIMSCRASSASRMVWAMTTPLPAASPSALMTMGKGCVRTKDRARS
jgi:hypothetical protein